MRSLRADPAETPAMSPEPASLSPRERGMLALIGERLTDRGIGKKLFLSEKTVKNHISRLPAKVGVQWLVQAAVIASPSDPPHTGERPGR